MVEHGIDVDFLIVTIDVGIEGTFEIHFGAACEISQNLNIFEKSIEQSFSIEWQRMEPEFGEFRVSQSFSVVSYKKQN